MALEDDIRGLCLQVGEHDFFEPFTGIEFSVVPNIVGLPLHQGMDNVSTFVIIQGFDGEIKNGKVVNSRGLGIDHTVEDLMLLDEGQHDSFSVLSDIFATHGAVIHRPSYMFVNVEPKSLESIQGTKQYLQSHTSIGEVLDRGFDRHLTSKEYFEIKFDYFSGLLPKPLIPVFQDTGLGGEWLGSYTATSLNNEHTFRMYNTVINGLYRQVVEPDFEFELDSPADRVLVIPDKSIHHVYGRSLEYAKRLLRTVIKDESEVDRFISQIGKLDMVHIATGHEFSGREFKISSDVRDGGVDVYTGLSRGAKVLRKR